MKWENLGSTRPNTDFGFWKGRPNTELNEQNPTIWVELKLEVTMSGLGPDMDGPRLKKFVRRA